MSTEVLTEIAYGEVFTRQWVVETMLNLVGYTPDQDLSRTRLIEPSVGSGDFIVPRCRATPRVGTAPQHLTR